MNKKLFWQLMEDVCQLGEFIAVIETDGAEINIVGRFQVIHDGIELVLEKQDCGDHFHIAPEKIQVIHFGYCKNDIGLIEPCLELINLDGQVCLILVYYPYQESALKPKYRQFMEEREPYRAYLTGEW
ncbi:MAG TPA: hypothetical protein VJM08_17005 [Anaerolineales bacterium]|nr:hypothetical protein [Anaerolineales bacterium]